jgi:exonuclease III
MRIVSANLNHRLGSASVHSQIEEWLSSHSPDLFVSQEPCPQSFSAPPELAGFTLLATNVLTSCCAADHHVPPTIVNVTDRWQKIVLDGLIVHNVYLSPYSAKERVELLHGIAEDLASTTDPVVIVGDFNLAPRPEDGIFGNRPSTFYHCARAGGVGIPADVGAPD